MSFSEFMDQITDQCSYDSDYPGSHISWWTPEKVSTILKEIGFRDIIISGYGQSSIPILRDTRYFDNTMPYLSFYIEAYK